MTTHLYTLCWNEAKTLGFFFRHYDPFVDRYIIYDDGSTDGSIEKLEAHPKVELRKWVRPYPDSFILSQREWMNTVWKESRVNADWVIIVDIDEHLFHPRRSIKDYLQSCKDQGVTFVPALGYQMISDEFPKAEEHLCYTRTCGAPFYRMSKPGVFNPKAIEESNIALGRHTAKASGKIIFPPHDEMLLLHYKFLGFEDTFERYEDQEKKLGVQDKAEWRTPFFFSSRSYFQRRWRNFQKNVTDLSSPDFNPGKDHSGKVWWRPGFRYYLFLLSRKLKWLFVPGAILRKIKKTLGLTSNAPQ